MLKIHRRVVIINIDCFIVFLGLFTAVLLK